MPALNGLITTFNCGRQGVQVDYFASSLYTSLKSGSLPPDLIVLALQEISPIGFSFIGGSFIAPYFSRFGEAVLLATAWAFSKDVVYEHVVTRNAGMTGIMVFARKEMKERIRSMKEAGTGVGFWEMGNKGAVGVRLDLEETAMTFVAAHLAPAEDACERRNKDWKTICENLVFEDGAKNFELKRSIAGDTSESEPLLAEDRTTGLGRNGQHGIFGPEPSHIFFAGDLNYRTSDTPPDEKDHESWPQPMASESDPSHFNQLLSKDQLTRELNNGRTLHHLAEANISFPPTYKYSTRAQQLARDNARQYSSASQANKRPGPTINLEGRQEQVWLWAKHRVPSWCDRILYLSDAQPQVHSYTALPVQPTSDHRPVSLSFSIPPRAPSAVTPPFEIVDGWKERRANARRLEILVGIGAYLSLTGQGQALLGGSLVGIVGAYFLLHSLL
ncbi:inositol 5-phosphatase like protein [Zymoseptoria brevis]|uniref:Inositol 5-phosphatase like protein n=1 Tax=Zymoseptoria brevis TaxID=1047168 RepID=A0A0F4GL83_9PEZI|nr:inositol 5-phosphatase like protein [Zymoseptoria brevis]